MSTAAAATDRRLVTVAEYSAILRGLAPGAEPADVVLCVPGVATVKAAGDASRVLEFTIGTGAVDRDRGKILTAGYQLDNYRRNPVVLWNHDWFSPPVARCLDVRVEGDALVARDEFADYDFADLIFRLYRDGFMAATSVGIRPIKSAYNNDRGGYDFDESELLEHSMVNIPSNPDALRKAAAAGVDLDPLRRWASETLERLPARDGIPATLTSSAVERALKACGVKDSKRFFLAATKSADEDKPMADEEAPKDGETEEKAPEMVDCEACAGSGKCAACDGAGKVEKRADPERKPKSEEPAATSSAESSTDKKLDEMIAILRAAFPPVAKSAPEPATDLTAEFETAVRLATAEHLAPLRSLIVGLTGRVPS